VFQMASKPPTSARRGSDNSPHNSDWAYTADVRRNLGSDLHRAGSAARRWPGGDEIRAQWVWPIGPVNIWRALLALTGSSDRWNGTTCRVCFFPPRVNGTKLGGTGRRSWHKDGVRVVQVSPWYVW
jgi:hypothetical protein